MAKSKNFVVNDSLKQEVFIDRRPSAKSCCPTFVAREALPSKSCIVIQAQNTRDALDSDLIENGLIHTGCRNEN